MAPTVEVAIEQRIGALLLDAQGVAIDQDDEVGARQEADEPGADAVDHEIVEAGVDREIDQGVEDAAIAEHRLARPPRQRGSKPGKW
jgi:hypothetical protein